MFANTDTGDMYKIFDRIATTDIPARHATTTRASGSTNNRKAKKQAPRKLRIPPRRRRAPWGARQSVRVSVVQCVGGDASAAPQAEPFTCEWILGISAPAPEPIVVLQPL
jgi:hypothetical protein